MATDGCVPSVDELLKSYQKRIFPARFGPDTKEERELMAMRQGKDPGFQLAGYLIAHIYDAGKSYYEDGKPLSLKKDILDVYFPRGERSEWKLTQDESGTFHLRSLNVAPHARKYMVAAFLRFVHPFNYFLMPKRGCCTEDISGNEKLLNCVKLKLKECYGNAYDEFLDMIMPGNRFIESINDMRLTNYKYGVCQKEAFEQCSNTEVDRTRESVGDDFVDIKNKKIGKIAQGELKDSLKKISLEEAEKLTALDYTKKYFNLSFPLLSKERRVVCGLHRYYASPIEIQNSRFYLTSQWYEKHRDDILRWLRSHRKV